MAQLFPLPLLLQIILLTWAEPAALTFNISPWRILVTQVECNWKTNLQVKVLWLSKGLPKSSLLQWCSAWILWFPGLWQSYTLYHNYRLDTKMKSLPDFWIHTSKYRSLRLYLLKKLSILQTRKKYRASWRKHKSNPNKTVIPGFMLSACSITLKM